MIYTGVITLAASIIQTINIMWASTYKKRLRRDTRLYWKVIDPTAQQLSSQEPNCIINYDVLWRVVACLCKELDGITFFSSVPPFRRFQCRVDVFTNFEPALSIRSPLWMYLVCFSCIVSNGQFISVHVFSWSGFFQLERPGATLLFVIVFPRYVTEP